MVNSNWRKRRSRALGFATLVAISLVPAQVAEPQDRMPPIPSEKMTDAQKAAVAEFNAARGGAGVGGPFVPLLRSPELLNRARAISDYVRFKSSLTPKIRELVILFTVSEWTLQLEWPGHRRLGLEAGLSPDFIAAIAEGRRPQHMMEPETAAYEFCLELRRNQSVSDATYAKALTNFGEQGIIDMIGLIGYYSFLGMVTNTARTPVSGGRAPELMPFPR